MVAELRDGPWELLRVLIKGSLQGREDDPTHFLLRQAALSRHRDRAERAIEEHGRVRSRRRGTRTRWPEPFTQPV